MRINKQKTVSITLAFLLIFSHCPIRSFAVNTDDTSTIPYDLETSYTNESLENDCTNETIEDLDVDESTNVTCELSSSAGNNCVTFYSSESFTLAKTSAFETDGIIQFLLGNPSSTSWTNWDNQTLESARHDGLYYISLRGVNATYVHSIQHNLYIFMCDPALTMNSTSAVDVVGYVESLLDYSTFASGNIPTMAQESALSALFRNLNIRSAPSFAATNLEGKKYCYSEMFYECESLETPPALPATTLEECVYDHMFYGCSALKSSPKLPAKYVPDQAYNAMFNSATSMTTAGEISAEVIGHAGCHQMFTRCSSLVNVPDFKCHTIGVYSMQMMFENCSSLKKSPAIPTTEIAELACEGMFQGCTSLTEVGKISATIVGNSGFSFLFYECTSLKEPPKLNLTTLGKQACQFMYSKCTSLTRPMSISATSYGERSCVNMYAGCSNLRIYSEPTINTYGSFAKEWKIPTATVVDGWKENMFLECPNVIDPQLNTSYYIEDDPITNTCLSFISEEAFSLSKTEYFTTDGTIEYCLGTPSASSFTTWNNETLTATKADDNKYYISLRGIGATYVTSSTENVMEAPLSMSATKAVECKGYVENILDYASIARGESPAMADKYALAGLLKKLSKLTTPPSFYSTSLKSYCYAKMFEECTSLTYAPSLPALDVPEAAYALMFYKCSNLVTANKISATKIGKSGCQGMFGNCTNLETIPSLDFEEVGESGCGQMFIYCSSLQSISDLKSITVPNSAYMWMFYGCESLQSAGRIYAKYLGESACDRMFQLCKSLVNPPVLDFETTSLNSCLGMFINCTSLIASPQLNINVIETEACENMFNGCSAIKTAGEIKATHIKEKGLYSAFSGCSSLISAGKIHATQVDNFGCGYLFYNCNNLKNVPEFNFTTLEERACESMFENCSSITAAPDLLATNIPKYGYLDMFKECTSLKTAGKIIAETSDDYACMEMFSGCSELTTIEELTIPQIKVSGCSEMFEGCSKLKTMPELIATTIGDYGYNKMFDSCISLENVNKIHAKTLGKYGCSMMFNYCTSLVNTPEFDFDSVDDYSCSAMFQRCTSLKASPEITINYIGLGSCSSMFSNCSALTNTGNITTTRVAESGLSYMFSACTSLVTPSDLKFNSLGKSACFRMFQGCSALARPAIHPVATLDESCYMNMYQDCNNIRVYNESTSNEYGDYTKEWSIISETTPTNWNSGMFNSFTPNINTTYFILEDKDTIDASVTNIDTVYDGMPHSSKINVTKPTDNYTIYYSTTEGDFSSTDEIKYTNAGNYTVYFKITAEGYTTLYGNYHIVIAKANLTVDAPDQTFTHDGKAHFATINITPSYAEYLIMYKTSVTDDYSPTRIPFYNAGTFTLFYIITSNNYNTYESSLTITINSLLTIEASASGIEATYDAKSHSGKVIVTTPSNPSDYQIYYSLDDGEYFLDNPSVISAGTHIVKYRITAEGYNDFNDEFVIIINKAELDVTVTNYEGTYDEAEHFGQINVSPISSSDTYTVYYSAKEGGEYSTTPIGYAKSGEHKVYYKVISDNYNDATGYITIKITSDTIEASAKDIEVIYDTKPHAGEVVVTRPNDSSAKISYSVDGGTTYTETNPSYINAGTYPVNYKVTLDNFEEFEGNYTIKILPAKMSVTTQNVDVIYNGKNHSGVVTPTLPLGGSPSIFYSLNGVNYTSEMPSLTNVTPDPITIYFKVTADNYEDYFETFTINIRPATFEVKANDIRAKYDGTSKSVDVNVPENVIDATVEYSLDGENFTEELPEVIEIGEYTMSYKVTAPNYNEVTGSYKITIIDKEIIEASNIYIMYNPNSGEHLFTSKEGEYDKLEKVGWKKEGTAFYAYTTEVEDSVAIYRVYNPNAIGGDHHYTKSLGEVNKLVKAGWKKDNQGKPVFYAKGDVVVYKLYNKGNGRHHYTRKKAENDKLVKLGWIGEGIAWYATIEGDTAIPKE